jgi:hypothetical protein
VSFSSETIGICRFLVVCARVEGNSSGWIAVEDDSSRDNEQPASRTSTPPDATLKQVARLFHRGSVGYVRAKTLPLPRTTFP